MKLLLSIIWGLTLVAFISAYGSTQEIAQTDTTIVSPISAPVATQEKKSNNKVSELFIFGLNKDEVGGFGYQLDQDIKNQVYLHGYAATWYRTNDLNRRKPNDTFSLQYFNFLLGINMDQVIVEMMAEYEHGGNELGIRYGFIDYTPISMLTMRIGKFLMPIGKFNEKYYPEYINKFNDRPIVLWQILPSVWSEIGAQLRGRLSLTNNLEIGYAAYIVNGLQQAAGEGGDIRKMRNNYRDYNDDNKAAGGRLSCILFDQVELGASYYQGAYTTTGDRKLSLWDIDFEYLHDKLTFRGELVYGTQEITDGQIIKKGGYLETGYKLIPQLEPMIRYDQAELPLVPGFDTILNTEIIRRITVGLNYYPMPVKIAKFSFKANYSFILNDGSGQTGNELVLQTAIGF